MFHEVDVDLIGPVQEEKRRGFSRSVRCHYCGPIHSICSGRSVERKGSRGSEPVSPAHFVVIAGSTLRGTGRQRLRGKYDYQNLAEELGSKWKFGSSFLPKGQGGAGAMSKRIKDSIALGSDPFKEGMGLDECYHRKWQD